MKKLTKLTACLLLLTCNMLIAQQATIDSLNNLLKKKCFKNNREHLNIMRKLCDQYIQNDLTKALVMARDFLTLATQYKVEDYEATAFESIGKTFYFQGKNDSALYYYTKGLNLRKKKKPDNKFFNIQANIALVFQRMGQYDTAMALNIKVLDYYESCKKELQIKQVLSNIGLLYHFAGNLKKAREYTLKSIEIARKLGNKKEIGLSLTNLVEIEMEENNFEEAIKVGKEAMLLFKPVLPLYYAQMLLRVGTCYDHTGNKEKEIQYILEAIKIFEENKSAIGLMDGYEALGRYYLGIKQYKKAKESGLKGLQIADTTNLYRYCAIYQILHESCIYLNEPEKAVFYYGESIRLLQKDLDKKWSEKIADADAKYQSEKKEKEILTLQNEKQISELIIKRRNLLIYALFITMSLLMGMAFLFYRHIHNKRIIAEQGMQIQKHKILQLENEKMLLATQSVLLGEENERKRIAKDLHDGLGGLLFGTKTAFNNMKNNVVLTNESVKDFNHALGMIETSILELRRVAHNMMPEALLNLGLKNALKDFCTELDKIDPTHIIFQFFGLFERVDSNLEINAYRIIQELVNNALKHSGAKELVVQMLQQQGRLCFTVQDNGIGFDHKNIGDKKGLGLASVQSRVDYFHGLMEINSEPSKGTEITIEFSI